MGWTLGNYVGWVPAESIWAIHWINPDVDGTAKGQQNNSPLREWQTSSLSSILKWYYPKIIQWFWNLCCGGRRVSGALKVMNWKISESVCLRFYARENNFGHRKWGQGHQKSSSTLFKCIFSSYVQKKAFWSSWEVKIRSRWPKVIKCIFSKSVFLSSYAQKEHFEHNGRSKSFIKCKFSKNHFLESCA